MPTSYFMSTPASAMSRRVATTTSLTNLSSLHLAHQGIMMCGTMCRPVSCFTLMAALMTAVVCISAISG